MIVKKYPYIIIILLCSSFECDLYFESFFISSLDGFFSNTLQSNTFQKIEIGTSQNHLLICLWLPAIGNVYLHLRTGNYVQRKYNDWSSIVSNCIIFFKSNFDVQIAASLQLKSRAITTRVTSRIGARNSMGMITLIVVMNWCRIIYVISCRWLYFKTSSC